MSIIRGLYAVLLPVPPFPLTIDTDFCRTSPSQIFDCCFDIWYIASSS